MSVSLWILMRMASAIMPIRTMIMTVFWISMMPSHWTLLSLGIRMVICLAIMQTTMMITILWPTAMTPFH